MAQSGQVDSAQFIDALGKVHEFYSASFSELVQLTFGVIAVVGVVLPLVITWYQSRRFKRDNSSLQAELKLFVEKAARDEFEKLKADVDKKFDESEKASEERHQVLDGKLTSKMKEVNAAIFHLQANLNRNQNQKSSAIDSYLIALRDYLSVNDQGNARTVTKGICDVLQSIEKAFFDEHPKLNEQLDKGLEALRKNNNRNCYVDCIETLESAVRKARARVAA